MTNLIVAAASPRAVRAAVESGADAVCVIPRGLGPGDAGARDRAGDDNFTVSSLRTAAEYCRLRGIRLYLMMENFPLDRDMDRMEKLLRLATRCGFFGAVVSDLGMARVVRAVTPDLRLYAGLQMSIHNAYGVHFLKENGYDGVFLAPEMTREQVDLLRRTVNDLDLVLTVHGRICSAYGGTCRLTEMTRPETGTAFTCGMVCEMPHGYGSQATDYPLTVKERCLAGLAEDVKTLSLGGWFITDQEGDASYLAAVTAIYRDILDIPSAEGDCENLLARLSKRGGVSPGGWAGRWEKADFGSMAPLSDRAKRYQDRALADAEEGTRACVPVRFAAVIRRGRGSLMAVQDADGHTFRVSGDMPVRDARNPLLAARVRTQLYKLEGTIYRCVGAKVQMDDGLMLPNEEILRMRDELLRLLTEARSEARPGTEGELPPAIRYMGERGPLQFTVSVTSGDQLSLEMLELKPAVVYVPLSEAAKIAGSAAFRAFLRARETEVCVTLPPAVGDDELQELRNELFLVKKAGVESVQVENVGQIPLAKMAGFKTLRGGLGLAARNSHALKALKAQGLQSACVSFTVPLRDMEQMLKTVDTEILAYGRVPLMVTRGCLIKNKSGLCSCESENHIVDERAKVYPLMKTFGCRNVMFSADKLFLGGLGARLRRTGVWGARLNFTTENQRECLSVMQRYMKGGSFEPNAWTTGLYLAGEEEENERTGPLGRLARRLRGGRTDGRTSL